MFHRVISFYELLLQYAEMKFHGFNCFNNSIAFFFNFQFGFNYLL